MNPLDNTFHAIVIGAGVNGLAAGLNLAAAGMKTLIVERSARVGGQAVSEDGLLPGFMVHPHANYLSYQDLLALRSDAAGRAMACRTVMPFAQHGLAFRDGRPPLVIYRKELAQKTTRSFAVFSKQDARAFAQAKARADRLTRALAGIYFSAPTEASIGGYARQVADAYAGLFDARRLGSRTAQQVIDGLFEADEVRTLFYRLTLELSGSLHDAGSDIAFLGYVMWLLGRRTLPLGGMGNVPAALAAAARAAGAIILCGVEVERICAPEGVVEGVRLKDGTFVSAAIVVSGADYEASIDGMLAGGATRAGNRLGRYTQVQSNMIGSYAACLAAAPAYRSGVHNADIDKCAQVFIGQDSTGEVFEHLSDLAAGRLPSPSGAIRMNSLWDATQAPAGHHAAGADCPFPGGLDDALRADVEASYPAAFAATWAAYAPNIGSAVLAHRIALSSDRARKLALRLGDEQYRGPVAGYYLCGASTHPGGGVHGACGVNAVATIRKDLGGRP